VRDWLIGAFSTGRFSRTGTGSSPGRWTTGRRGLRWIMPTPMRPAGRLCGGWGEAGWLKPTGAGEGERLDVRTLCLAREVLARHDGLADFAFAMQGLGMGAVTLFGTPAQREWLERTRAGAAIAGFALTEPQVGVGRGEFHDDGGAGRRRVGARRARRPGSRTGGSRMSTPSSRARGRRRARRGCRPSSCRPKRPGLTVAERLETVAPHPLGALRFEGCGCRRTP
jgi:acyl-CoA dehydrogenase